MSEEKLHLFGAPSTADVRHDDKVAELRRELAMREEVYPRLIDAGKLDQDEAARRTLILQAILEDYDVDGTPPARRS